MRYAPCVIADELQRDGEHRLAKLETDSPAIEMEQERVRFKSVTIDCDLPWGLKVGFSPSVYLAYKGAEPANDECYSTSQAHATRTPSVYDLTIDSDPKERDELFDLL